MQFIKLRILFKQLETNCNRFKETNWVRRCWYNGKS